MTRQQIAAQIAADKSEHPEKFCPVKKCLWRTGDGSRCPRHKETAIYVHKGILALALLVATLSTHGYDGNGALEAFYRPHRKSFVVRWLNAALRFNI